MRSYVVLTAMCFIDELMLCLSLYYQHQEPTSVLGLWTGVTAVLNSVSFSCAYNQQPYFSFLFCNHSYWLVLQGFAENEMTEMITDVNRFYFLVIILK